MRFFRKIGIALLVCSMSGIAACDSIDDTRLPYAPVNITFANAGMWNTYGIGGALDTRAFILTPTSREPANFPYTASSATGFGGVLLVGDYYGNPVAYDMACPVECRSDVRVYVDTESQTAECPKCHSTYAIYENFGHPLSGPAAENGYGLQRYKVMQGAGNYYAITR